MKFLFLFFISLFCISNVHADGNECADFFITGNQKQVLMTFIDDRGEIKKLLGSNWSGELNDFTEIVSKLAQTYDVNVGVRSSDSRTFSYYHLAVWGPSEQVKLFLVAYYKKFFTGLNSAEKARRIENTLNP